MATKREKLLQQIDDAQSRGLPDTDDPQFLRYVLKSIDKFDDIDWDVMKSVYTRAVHNGDIVPS